MSAQTKGKKWKGMLNVHNVVTVSPLWLSLHYCENDDCGINLTDSQ